MTRTLKRQHLLKRKEMYSVRKYLINYEHLEIQIQNNIGNF